MRYFLIFLTLVIIISCKKDKITTPTPTPHPVPPSEIEAGAASSSVTVNDIRDTLVYKYSLAGDDFGFSFDLNGDGVNDFKLSNANGHPCGGGGTYNNNFITTLTNDAYVDCDSIYQDTLIAHSQSTPTAAAQTTVTTRNEVFPKIVNASDQIKLTDRWRQGKIFVSEWGSVCGFVTASSCWMNADHKYIALRYKNLLGWVKVSITRYNSGIVVYEISCAKS